MPLEKSIDIDELRRRNEESKAKAEAARQQGQKPDESARH